MRDFGELAEVLRRLDGRGYKAYQEIRGEWRVQGGAGAPAGPRGDYTFAVDHVQGDPFAAPSRLRLVLPGRVAAFPEWACRPGSRSVGLAALLARRFAAATREVAGGRGSGRSGEIHVEAPGQEVIPQTAVQVAPDGGVEARFQVGLPARGRRILGRQAAELLTEDVPASAAASLLFAAHDESEVRRHVEANEDADHLRALLPELGLVAFVADGAVLPRRSGVDDRPLARDVAVEFRSPETLRTRVVLPNAGEVTGMGVSRGVTLVVGGGYHGKSTLLRALERGVYNHRPGDGRERVVAAPATVKVRAEDGRSVAGVDISAFIGSLPGGEDTRRFTTPNASGSTSQAAAIMEAVEAGASALLVDEDTAATNLMIRDRRMQALVPREHETITPFVDRVRQLHETYGLSSVLVLGGSGDYLDVADTVIAMVRYRAHDVTEEARRVAHRHPTGRVPEAAGPLGPAPARVPLPHSVDLRRGRREASVRVRGPRTLELGRELLDLAAVEQLVSWAQVRALGEALVLARRRFMDGRRTLAGILDAVMEVVDSEGLDALDPRRPGDLAAFRRFELAAALSRLRTLETEAPP